MWLREENGTELHDDVLYGKTFEDIQLTIMHDRKFMYPDGYKEMTAEERLLARKERMLELIQEEMLDSVRCAMEILEEYAEDLIKITAPREKTVDGEVKTLQGWKDSEINNFHDYAKEGDKVDYDIVMEFANCVPPRTFTSGMVQCGEPYDHVKEGARYGTFIYLYKDENYGGEVWQYKGNCLAGGCEKGTEIPRV